MYLFQNKSTDLIEKEKTVLHDTCFEYQKLAANIPLKYFQHVREFPLTEKVYKLRLSVPSSKQILPPFPTHTFH